MQDKEYKFSKDYTYQLDATRVIKAKAGETHPVPNCCVKSFAEKEIIDIPKPSAPPAPREEGKKKSVKNAPKDKSIPNAPKDK